MNNSPKDIHALIPGMCECYLKWQKRLCRFDHMKVAEMGRFSWIVVVGSKCNLRCPYKREAEGDLRTKYDVM